MKSKTIITLAAAGMLALGVSSAMIPVGAAADPSSANLTDKAPGVPWQGEVKTDFDNPSKDVAKTPGYEDGVDNHLVWEVVIPKDKVVSVSHIHIDLVDTTEPEGTVIVAKDAAGAEHDSYLSLGLWQKHTVDGHDNFSLDSDATFSAAGSVKVRVLLMDPKLHASDVIVKGTATPAPPAAPAATKS